MKRFTLACLVLAAPALAAAAPPSAAPSGAAAREALVFNVADGRFGKAGAPARIVHRFPGQIATPHTPLVLQALAVPEPGTLALAGLGLGLALWGGRRGLKRR